MSRRLILVLALAIVVMFAVGAYAEVQNVKVSGDIKVTDIMRNFSTLRKDNTTGANGGFTDNISGFISQVRVKVDADLTDNVSTTVRLINERVWETETVSNTDIDLDLAYVQLKEFLYSPLSLTIGRQELRYGNGMVIGAPYTNTIAAGHIAALGGTQFVLPTSVDDLSLRRGFDAIKAVLNYDPLVVDLYTARVNNSTAIGINNKNNTDLYGINASYNLNKNTNVEGYLIQRTRKLAPVVSAVDNKTENLRTVGVKGAYTGVKNLMVSLESAFQFGNHMATDAVYPNEGQTSANMRNVTAYALQGIASYAFPKVKYTPVVSGSYTLFSGEKYKSTNDKATGWDPMYEDQLGGTILNKLLYNNFQLFNLGASIKPMDDVKIGLDYYYARLLHAYTDTASSTNVVLNGVPGDPTYNMKTNKNSFGQEVELGVTYDYTEDVQFNLTGGLFAPGDAFTKDNKQTANQVVGSMKVTF